MSVKIKGRIKRCIAILLAKILSRMHVCVAVNIKSSGKIRPINIFQPAIALDCESAKFNYFNYGRRLFETGKEIVELKK